MTLRPFAARLGARADFVSVDDLRADAGNRDREIDSGIDAGFAALSVGDGVGDVDLVVPRPALCNADNGDA